MNLLSNSIHDEVNSCTKCNSLARHLSCVFSIMRVIKYKIEKEGNILAFLKSKAYSSRLISELRREENGIVLNGEKAKTTAEMNVGDSLIITLPDGESEIEGVDLPLEVIYEDEDVLVVNKAPFTVCHPTRNHQGDTLANAVAFHLQRQGKKCTFRAINRLDRDTTGLVVIALNRYSAGRLAGKIDKIYLALATGEIKKDGTINMPIERVDERKILRTVGENGQSAVTHYEVIKSTPEATLLKIKLETGRTHQIRVHFKAIGHPLVGDTMYGTADERIPRQCLHCTEVSFRHPVSEEEITLHSKAEFEEFV